MNPNFKLNSDYIEQFWLGLLEGDGTITVSRVKNSNSLRISIVISLLNVKGNFEMLKLIQEIIGGRVSIERNDRYVTWIAVSKKDLIKAFGILSKYPLITTRKQLQLKFALNCFNNPEIKNFLYNRDNKYLNLEGIRTIEDFSLIPYFKGWLSGFIEAEGNFKLVLRDTGFISSCSFNIGQNTDKFVLYLIKTYFNSNHVITTDKKETNFKHYRISLSGPSMRINLIDHFNQYPLLGNKQMKYND